MSHCNRSSNRSTSTQRKQVCQSAHHLQLASHEMEINRHLRRRGGAIGNRNDTLASASQLVLGRDIGSLIERSR
jgi:hypothetical protein